MTYRDDREALHHRVAQLQQELDDARREGEQQGRDEAQQRTAELEQKLGSMRGEIERMELELQAMRGAAPKGPSRTAPLVIGAVVLALGATATFLIVARSPSSVPVVVVQAPPVATPHAPTKQAEPAPEPIAPAPPEVRNEPAQRRTTTARWTATVARAEGLPLAPGTSCTIEATVATTDTNATVPALEVLCGTQKLYRSKDALNGMAQMSNDADRSGHDGTPGRGLPRHDPSVPCGADRSDRQHAGCAARGPGAAAATRGKGRRNQRGDRREERRIVRRSCDADRQGPRLRGRGCLRHERPLAVERTGAMHLRERACGQHRHGRRPHEHRARRRHPDGQEQGACRHNHPRMKKSTAGMSRARRSLRLIDEGATL
jgi:hypothetical protein